jgi:MraZ protein
MSQPATLILGEFSRVYDDRYRIALPPECVDLIAGEDGECILAKEREGCLSLWNAELWKQKFDSRVQVLQQKYASGMLDRSELVKLQRLSRLLSTRSRPVKLGQRGRLLVPEGFREFLAVTANSEVIIVGAGLCLEIWNPQIWHSYLREDVGEFHTLFEEML